MKKIDVDTRKLIGTIVGSIAFICCIIFMTYAFYTWRSENLVVNKNIVDENSNVVDIVFENNGNVNISNMAPVLHISDGEITNFYARNNGSTPGDIYIDLKINTISNELKNESFKYAIVKGKVELPEENTADYEFTDEVKSTVEYDYTNIVSTGNFSSATTNTTITIGEDEVDGKSIICYKVIFYIDGNMKNNTNMMGKSFNADITIRNTDAPTANITTTKTKQSTSQTMTLTCADTKGVSSYYLGGTSPTSSSTYTAITPQREMTMTSTISSQGTYYFACKDTDGNTSKIKTVSFYNYTITTMFLNLNGTEGEYTLGNYSNLGKSTNYLASNLEPFDLSNYYTIPTGASASTFRGYSTSSTPEVLQNADPILNSKTNFFMWFDRKNLSIYIKSDPGGNVTITRNNINEVYKFYGKGTKSISNIRYGETLTFKATPATGNTFSGWSGMFTNSSLNVSRTITTSGATIIASFVDEVAPTVNLTVTTNPLYKKKIIAVSLTCSDNSKINSYYFGTEDPTVENFSKWIGYSKEFTSELTTKTTSRTIDYTQSGTYYFACKDENNNISTKLTKTFYKYTVFNVQYRNSSTPKTYYTESSGWTLKSTSSYIIPRGAGSFYIRNVWTIPSGSSSSSYLGYSKNDNVTSVTGGTTASTSITSDRAKLYLWFKKSS